MQSHIRQIKEVCQHSPLEFVKFSSIGKSNAGIDVPVMKITNVDKKKKVQKPTIVILGRQHSGETHSSFIIHGLINFLLSRDVLSHKLRENLEFWIIPMVNPDGIVSGNYRCTT